MRSRKSIIFVALAVAITAMAFAATGAAAHGGGHDKGNGHGWMNAALADTDGDGANAFCETKAGTDPAVADSNGNGTADGLEDTDGDGANNAAESKLWTDCGTANTKFRVRGATVVSYSDGKLTLKVGEHGGLVTEPVADDVVITKPDPAAVSKKGAVAHNGSKGKDGNCGHRGHRHHHGKSSSVAGTTADLTAEKFVWKAKVDDGKFVKIYLGA